MTSTAWMLCFFAILAAPSPASSRLGETRCLAFGSIDFALTNIATYLPETRFSNVRDLQIRFFNPEGEIGVFRGASTQRLLAADFIGVPVVIKYPKPNYKDANLRFIRECEVAKILSDHGLGARFLGYTMNAKGEAGLVTELIPDSFDFTIRIRSFPENFEPTAKTLQRLVFIRQELIRLNLTGGSDLQLRFTRHGDVFVVDADGFSSNPPHPKILEEMDAFITHYKFLSLR